MKGFSNLLQYTKDNPKYKCKSVIFIWSLGTISKWGISHQDAKKIKNK